MNVFDTKSLKGLQRPLRYLSMLYIFLGQGDLSDDKAIHCDFFETKHGDTGRFILVGYFCLGQKKAY